MQQRFYVGKHTGTISDALLAYGAAWLIDAVVSHATDGRTRATISDEGPFYRIDAGVTLQDEWLDYDPVLVPLVTDAKHPPPEDLPALAVRDVNETWTGVRRYFEQLKLLRETLQKDQDWKQQAEAGRKNPNTSLNQLLSEEVQHRLQDQRLPPDWTVVTYVGDYRMQAQDNHNQLIVQWSQSNKQRPGLALRTVLRMLATPQTNLDALIEEWKKQTKGDKLGEAMVTATQLLNPHMGKGQNRAKANGLVMSNEKSFWLLEFLKVLGLWAAALPAKAPESELRKTYALAPKRLEMRFHQRVFADFRSSAPTNETSVKQDSIAVLRYTISLLEHLVEEENDEDLAAFGGRVSDLVHGLAVATYQLLSRNSYTTMNIAFLGLPDWMPRIEKRADAQLFTGILHEHLQRITVIDEKASEGQQLLTHYREFVTSNRLQPFFDFCAGYSSYLLSALDHKRWMIRPFLTNNMEALLTMNNKKYSPILASEGFRHIAAAIRRSTLALVYQDPSKRRYDIRYGLGQELQRQARYDDEFLRALGDFVQSYNDETLRVRERTKGKDQSVHRPLVTTHDLEDIVALVDEYGARTICNLLIAYGYAREPKEADKDPQPGDALATGIEPEQAAN